MVARRQPERPEPLLRAGFALAAVVPIALASDTFSIATMEVIDNAVIVVVPGAMDRRTFHTSRWKGEPRSATGVSNTSFSPEK